MQRGGGGMRGFRVQGKGSVKARLGLPGVGGGVGRRVVVAGRLQSRGAVGGGVKSRLGGVTKLSQQRSVAGVMVREMLDARQKLNFKRVQSGRIGDARYKIEEKRRKKVVTDGRVRNLRIMAPMDNPFVRGRGERERGPVAMSAQGGFVSRSEMEYGGGGGFRSSALQDRFSFPPLRTAAGMRIAPPSEDDLMLTRTIRNPTAAAVCGGGMRSDYIQRPVRTGAAAVHYASHPSYGRGRSPRDDQMDMDADDYEHYDRGPLRRQGHPLGGGLDGCRILVSNLQPSVTADDIVELFSDIGTLLNARMTGRGQAEVTYTSKSDAAKAIEAYHNRLLDGSAMRVFLDTLSTAARPSASDIGTFTALKSAAGASMKLPAGKAPSGLKIQPDIQAIHKVLFNPSSSSATRGLFKGGQ